MRVLILYVANAVIFMFVGVVLTGKEPARSIVRLFLSSVSVANIVGAVDALNTVWYYANNAAHVLGG